MQGQVLVDTDVVIDFLNGFEPQASAVEKLLIEHRLSLAVISVFELCAGVTGKRRIAIIDRFVRNVTVFEIGTQEAKKAASMYTDLKGKGRLVSNSDLLIAAVAVSNGVPLYTRNVGHFDRIEGLTLWDPTSSSSV